MASSPPRPNIILINCDDLGYGDLGCYGSQLHRTPALDRLAAEGVLFTDFHMAASVCSPSRAAMMTGCYPPRIGMETGCEICVLRPNEPMGLHPEEITIADVLKDAGYATKIIGKWHCGDQEEFLPTRHGFDSWYGLPYSNDMGRTKANPQFPPLPLMRDEEVIQQQPDQAALTERYTEDAVSFLRDHRDQPFFLYFAHMYVHVPIYAPQAFLERSQNGAYGAAVEHCDWSVACLLTELERLGIADNTLIVFTSDNGGTPRSGASNAPLRGTKKSRWEGGFRLPCVMRWPAAIPAGRVCDELTTSMDFLPTFAKLAGAEPPQDRLIDGRDIRPLLLDEPGAASPHEVFYYYMEHELQAIRSGDWKLHLVDGELYNLREDIGEAEDRSDSEPEVCERLRKLAEVARADIGDSLTGAPGENRRPCGWVDNPVPLTTYAEDHPYMIALYD